MWKVNSYTLFRILSYVPDLIVRACDGWNRMCWFYCHYKWGDGPRLNEYKTNPFKEFMVGFRSINNS